MLLPLWSDDSGGGGGMKPILFSTPMVKAILEGRKSQTRRVVKPQPEGLPMYCYAGSHKANIGKWHHGGKRYTPPCHGDDILWVRETWYYEMHMYDPSEGDALHRYIYKASSPDYPVNVGVGQQGWRPSIHMPKEAARLWLTVKEVRVERLQDITEEDAEHEGVSGLDDACYCNNGWSPTYYDPDSGGSPIFRDGFIALWDSINGKKYPWESNPYVWAISFERRENHGR